jgi:hypothetical protein
MIFAFNLNYPFIIVYKHRINVRATNLILFTANIGYEYLFIFININGLLNNISIVNIYYSRKQIFEAFCKKIAKKIDNRNFSFILKL